MPYKIKKSGNGYKVSSPNRTFSKKPMSKAKATAQLRAIYANTKGESLEQKIDRAIMAEADIDPMTGESLPQIQDDIEISNVDLFLEESMWDDPAPDVYMGEGPYASRMETTGVNGIISFTLGDTAYRQIVNSLANGESLSEMVEDLQIEDWANQIVADEFGNGIRVISWTPTLRGRLLVLQPNDSDTRDYNTGP